MTDSQMTAMRERLGKYVPKTETQEEAPMANERVDERADERISSSPKSKGNKSSETGDLYRELSSIELGLAGLVDEYGKLDTRFGDIVGSERYLKPADVAQIIGWGLLLQKKKVMGVKISAQNRKGSLVDFLSNRMAEVLTEQHEHGKRGVSLARGVLADNTAHRKKVSKNLVSRLTGSYVSDSDLALAQRDVAKREKELGEYEALVTDYEGKIIKAREEGDTATLDRLTGELTQLINDQGVTLDGKQDADAMVHEIKRKLLDYSEGVRSAKNALGTLRVSDLQCNSLIDSWNKLEIKYRHAKDDMVEIYRIQGKIAAYGTKGREMNEMLTQTATLYRRLLEHNEKLVIALSQETFKMIQTDLYDPEQNKKIEARLAETLSIQEREEMAWAQAQQTRSENMRKAEEFITSTPLPAGPGYTKQN